VQELLLRVLEPGSIWIEGEFLSVMMVRGGLIVSKALKNKSLGSCLDQSILSFIC
jgi:hypothetical protein